MANTQSYEINTSELSLKLRSTFLTEHIMKDITIFGKIKDSELEMRFGYLKTTIFYLFFFFGCHIHGYI